jgi:hypothetical protein
LAAAATARARRRIAALALDNVLHLEIVLPLEGQGVGDAEVPDPEAPERRPVDLLDLPLDQRMVCREGNLRTERDRRQRHPIGAVQLLHESAGRLYRGLAASRDDARAIDDQHDQSPAHGVGVRAVVRRSGGGRRSSRGGRHRHELRCHDLARPPIHAKFEVRRRQVRDGFATSVDRADVHPDDIDRRSERLPGGGGLCLSG